MTGSVREDGFASSGSADMSPEQRVPEWGGDQLADRGRRLPASTATCSASTRRS